MRGSLTTLLVFILPASTVGAILNVPGDYATIQLALESAGQCDTILLDSGIYSEEGFKDFYLDNQCLSIISAHGPQKTVIDLDSSLFLYVSDTLLAGNGYVYVKGITFMAGRPAIESGYNGIIDIKKCHFSNCTWGVLDTCTGAEGLIDSCEFFYNGPGVRVKWQSAWSITNSVFVGNSVGISNTLVIGGTITDNIFAYNYDGVVLYVADSFYVENNMLYRNHTAIEDDNWTQVAFLSCNNYYGNKYNTFNFAPGDQIGQNGNISEDPKFCDTTLAVTTVFDTSPLLPENNECGVNIGNVEVGCLCGDIDRDDVGPNVADLTYLVDYLFQGGAPPPLMAAANVDGQDGVNVADLTYLVDYLFRSGPPPVCGQTV